MNGFDEAIDKLEFHKIRERIARYALSDAGREVLLTLPISVSLPDIRIALDRVSEMKQFLVEEGGLPFDSLQSSGDAIRKSAVEGLFLQPREFLQIASMLRAARVLRSSLAKRKEISLLLWELVENIHTDKVLEYNIEQAIDETGAVKSNASKELQSISRAIADRYDNLRKKLEGILRHVSGLGFSQEEIITTREGRMVIPVKSEHKNQVPGFMHSASSSGATVFIEPAETLDLNNEIRSLQFQEQREIERILRALTGQVGASKDSLLRTSEILTTVDVLHAKAKYSIETLGVGPTVQHDGPFILKQGRHPILLMNHGYNQTVPLDMILGDGFTTLVISGPNAGGKSVAMKAIGLFALMVQAGLHISASDQTRVRIFQNLLVDIGDNQSIENDLSTFSSHLRHLKNITEQADDDTLVLIDEIGSGTDPSEGGAFAAAMLELLTQRGTYTIATTHHGALKAFAYETPGIENGAMEFDQSTLTPTYRFRSGVPGSSYALEMATRMGFEDGILRRSREFLGVQQTRLDSLITNLEATVQQHKRDVETLREEKTRVGVLIREYETKIKYQSTELRALKQKAIEEAKGIVDSANAVIERSIREIKETSADKNTVKLVRDELSQLKRSVEKNEHDIAPEMTTKTNAVAVGTTVRLKGGQEDGEVISLSPDGKTAVVVFGAVKMKVACNDLILASGRKPQVTRMTNVDNEEKRRSVVQDLDLRGLTGEEALPMVDKIIDDAMLAGLYRVDIIHGKGTGALRKKVTDFLSQHPRVKSFRFGEWNEGGMGATVVELQD
ncbi:MAG: endonuclease MutS2 [Bacteroidota bacterium]